MKAIIRRPWRYAGYVEFNRISSTGRPFVRTPGRSSAIISEETAQKAEEMREKRCGEKQRMLNHALSGIVWCATCGSKMRRNGDIRVDGQATWRCRGGHRRASIDEYALRATLKAAIETLAEHLTHNLFDAVADKTETDLQSAKIETKNAIDECYARIERLDEAYSAGVMDLDRYAKQVKAVQTKLDALTERMKVLQSQHAKLGTVEDKLARRQEVIDRGLSVLDENTPDANAFLRTHVRLWCAERRVVKVEFI